MVVEFNHTIIWARDSKASARFLAEILGLPAPITFGSFEVVKTTNGVSLDFMEGKDEIHSRHFAFLVSESEFDEIFGRIRERGLSYWAAAKRAKSIITMAGAGSTSTTRTGICSKSSRGSTAAAAEGSFSSR
jgi:hypothetical protein